MNNTLIIIGIVLIVIGIIAFAITITEDTQILGGLIEQEEKENPYRIYSYPLIILGIVLIILGFILNR